MGVGGSWFGCLVERKSREKEGKTVGGDPWVFGDGFWMFYIILLLELFGG